MIPLPVGWRRSVIFVAAAACATVVFQANYAVGNRARFETAARMVRVRLHGTTSMAEAPAWAQHVFIPPPEAEWAGADAFFFADQDPRYFRWGNLAAGIPSGAASAIPVPRCTAGFWLRWFSAAALVALAGVWVGRAWAGRGGRWRSLALSAAAGPGGASSATVAAIIALAAWPLTAFPVWYITCDRSWDSARFLAGQVSGTVPTLLSLGVLGLMSAIAGWAARRADIARVASALGACRQCGYLIGVRGLDRCPECGTHRGPMRREASGRRVFILAPVCVLSVLLLAVAVAIVLPADRRRAMFAWIVLRPTEIYLRDDFDTQTVHFRPEEVLFLKWGDGWGVIAVDRQWEKARSAGLPAPGAVVETRAVAAFWPGSPVLPFSADTPIREIRRSDPIGYTGRATISVGPHEVAIVLSPPPPGALLTAHTTALLDFVRYPAATRSALLKTPAPAGGGEPPLP